MARRILITGGAGFIGANLVRRLASSSDEVIVFDDLSQGKAENLPDSAVLIQGDVRDSVALSSAMDGAETVIHLAASGSVVESVIDPRANFETNVVGTFRVLECAKDVGASRLIFASTGGALIGDATPPVDERSLPKPISPYGSSKLCGEAYCHAFARSYGLRTISLRFANVYGPFSAHKKGAVTKFIQALRSEEPITIFGDGSASRDLMHVDDLCTGILSAIDADVLPGTVLHLASGVETTVTRLAEILCASAGRQTHSIRYEPARRGEVGRNFASYAAAHELLNFEPSIGVDEGLAQTWQWFLAHTPAPARDQRAP